MKMKQIKTKSVKDNMSYLLFILVFLPLFNLSAQNFVGSGGEFFSGPLGYDLGSASDWSTDRSSALGYYSWANGTTTSSYTGLSATNNINGYVKKYGVDAFVFPIGSGTDMRTLKIAAATSGATTDAYAAAWIDGDPSIKLDPTSGDVTHPITSISGIIVDVSTVGQWDWQAVSVGSGAGLEIEVSIPAIQATGAFSNPVNLRLVGWDGSKWINLGTTGTTSLNNYSALKGTMVAGIQAIGIGAACGAGINYPTIQ